jgi:hypothetical protein
MSESNEASDRAMPTLTSVYEALAQHQVSNTWDLQDLLRELHRWMEILVFEFKLEIPDIALCVDRLRFRRHGHFRRGHNGFGLEGEIGINRRHINGKEFWEVLGTLLHELLHGWQEARGKPAKGNYHNLQFRRKAAEFGLIVNERGEQQYEPDGPFMLLLGKRGVHVPKLPEPTPTTVGCSTLKLWICRCDPPFRLRVARGGFSATCNHCGYDYFQPDNVGRRGQIGRATENELSPAHAAFWAPSLQPNGSVQAYIACT